jgi:hypothetical protein
VHGRSRYTDLFTGDSNTSELPQEQQQQQKQLPLADVREQLTRVVASCAQVRSRHFYVGMARSSLLDSMLHCMDNITWVYLAPS